MVKIVSWRLKNEYMIKIISTNLTILTMVKIAS